MEGSDWTRYDISVSSRLAAVLLITLPAIALSNTLNLVTFKQMKKLQLQHYLIICLSVVDLATVLPHLVGLIGYLKGYLILNYTLCQVIAISNHAVVSATTWIHCGICINKCLSILKPLMHRQFVTKYQPRQIAAIFSVTIIVLIFALMSGVSFTGVINAVFNPVAATCMYFIDLPYLFIVGMSFIFIPLVTALVTHILILIEIRKSNLRRKKRIKNAMKSTAFIVIVYYVCWLPYLVFVIWQISFPKVQLPKLFEFVSINLIIGNSCMNLFIYCFCNKDFRESLKDLFLRKKRTIICERAGDHSLREAKSLSSATPGTDSVE